MKKTIVKLLAKIKQFAKDVCVFVPLFFTQSWISLKWDWAHRREKNNRAKKRRRRNELDHYWHERWLKAEGRI